MKHFSFKRLLALILVVMMTITVVPFHAFAQDSHDHEVNSESEALDGIESKPFEETVLLNIYLSPSNVKPISSSFSNSFTKISLILFIKNSSLKIS